jgi:uncharacterized UBP type Zn finger protein
MSCVHTATFGAPGWVEPVPNSLDRCADCPATVWTHLRLCLSCGYVGCCDSTPQRHATRHYQSSGHPVMRSFEPGESWRWCYVDERIV